MRVPGPFPAPLLFTPATEDQPPCFALLDDCTATTAEPRSRLYTAHAGTLSCQGSAQLPLLLDSLQTALAAGWHAVLLLDYELGGELPPGAAGTEQTPAAGQGQALLFHSCRLLDAEAAGQWLETACRSADAQATPAGVAGCTASVGTEEFSAALARIHRYLEAGETYQVNYTYRLHCQAYGTPAALYRRLRARQPVPYGALIALPDGQAVLSLSPELFVRHTQGRLTAQPMKGTASAGGDAGQDAANAAALAGDPKGQAENLMIVDLLRNDLGRIARPGSVRVPDLFAVARHGEVLQMTSTITAELLSGTGLAAVFAALYPCGSITGAPKHRTMQLIRELESAPRGLYTGALGWLAPPAQAEALGDFCLSVPIRTLALQAPDAHGTRAGILGIGAGIVHDSDPSAEYAECQLKARFLTGLPPDFELFETMHASHAQGCRHLDLHLQRLFASADHFGFAYDAAAIRAQLQAACARLPTEGSFRLRLSLQADGRTLVNTAPLLPLKTPVRVLAATAPNPTPVFFRQHKTSVRYHYDAGWRFAEQQGAFDVLFCNHEGEVTEGGRSSLFARFGKRWHTPPLSAGLLPGVMRTLLLQDPAYRASERSMRLEDLKQADEILVCNALRGVLPATLDWDIAWHGA